MGLKKKTKTKVKDTTSIGTAKTQEGLYSKKSYRLLLSEEKAISR